MLMTDSRLLKMVRRAGLRYRRHPLATKESVGG
jgi:hypothetical protein